MKHTEEAIQETFVYVVRRHFPNVLMCGGFAGETLGGGKFGIIRGARRKRAGYLAGFPDIFVIEPKSGYHGLFIEFKDKNGVQSVSQKEFESKATARGYLYKICRTPQEAIDLLENYIKGNIKSQNTQK